MRIFLLQSSNQEHEGSSIVMVRSQNFGIAVWKLTSAISMSDLGHIS